jgi:hypothetical protein
MGRGWLLCLLAACAEGGAPGGGGDGGRDAPCTPKTFFTDSDGDLHGDASRMMSACEQPAGTVTASDDCDDTTAQRYPGLAEICDGLDNDCNSGTAETCPAGCSPLRRPAPDDKKTYLFCNAGVAWTTARATCAGAQYKLVQIEDAAENGFIRTTANTLFGGVDLHIGGSDAVTEGMWIWDGSDPFWTGGSGGAPVMNRYANWTAGEPNDDGTEDCAEMKPTGQWNDGSCGDGQRFVCRR